jgi:hypothetical protein
MIDIGTYFLPMNDNGNLYKISGYLVDYIAKRGSKFKVTLNLCSRPYHLKICNNDLRCNGYKYCLIIFTRIPYPILIADKYRLMEMIYNRIPNKDTVLCNLQSNYLQWYKKLEIFLCPPDYANESVPDYINNQPSPPQYIEIEDSYEYDQNIQLNNISNHLYVYESSPPKYKSKNILKRMFNYFNNIFSYKN